MECLNPQCQIKRTNALGTTFFQWGVSKPICCASCNTLPNADRTTFFKNDPFYQNLVGNECGKNCIKCVEDYIFNA